MLIEQSTYQEFIDQKFLIEPLGGPSHPAQYTDRFPDTLYRLTPESHLIRFLYALIGPAGVGWLRKNSMDARLALEGQGLALFDLDRFYGDPMGFGRIVEETYEEDPSGLLSKEEWETIRSKDEQYRSRAIDFMNGAKAGNTPLGMHLVARSGIGHECEIIENYAALFDMHSDDPKGIPYFGNTYSPQEMIVLPRREVSRSEIQKLTITGDPTGGTFVLFFNGQNTTPLTWDSDFYEVEAALRAVSNIGDNVEVRGGPAPAGYFEVYFRGQLADQDVPQLTAQTSFTGGDHPGITIETTAGGRESTDEIVSISARDRHNLQTAVDRIRPIGALPTLSEGKGLRTRQHWNSALASSEYNEVIRYVTGNPNVVWPNSDRVNWIERGREKEGRRVAADLQFHYQGFHNIFTTYAYTDAAVEDTSYLTDIASVLNHRSEHIGRFSAAQRALPAFHYLSEYTDDHLIFTADRVLADYTEPLTVTTQTTTSSIINGIYPSAYAGLSGIPEIRYKDEQFWASQERPTGDDYLEIDFGTVRAVNFIAFEISKKPITFEVAFDTLGLSPRRRFTDATVAVTNSPTSTHYNPVDQNPWESVQIHFQDRLGRIPLTRYVRLKFSRQAPFLFNSTLQLQNPWSIEVKNLRIGRNESNI